MNSLHRFALAATLLGAASAQAAVVLNFDTPNVIGFNPDGTQTLVEQAYRLDGPLFSFLPVDNAGNGSIVGDGTPFSLRQLSGGNFSLLSLDYAFDPIFGASAGQLTVFGLFDGLEVARRTLALGAPTEARFDGAWSRLTSVRFSATSGFSVDNVALVPEPGSLALAALGLGLVGLVVGRRRSSGHTAGRAPLP